MSRKLRQIVLTAARISPWSAPTWRLFLLARNLRLRLFLAVVDARFLVRVDGHELIAIPVNAVFEISTRRSGFLRARLRIVMP